MMPGCFSSSRSRLAPDLGLMPLLVSLSSYFVPPRIFRTGGTCEGLGQWCPRFIKNQALYKRVFEAPIMSYFTDYVCPFQLFKQPGNPREPVRLP